MDELIPVFIAFAFGSLIWHISCGIARIVFSATAIVLTALVATVLSGEFHGSWIYLLVDLAEASAGFAGAIAAQTFILQRRGVPGPARAVTLPI
ncbi:MAG TPA: hypothetical protein VN950_10505 [Terriglobales bacterium]|nr:hypothetical protein [Terriglobales bacterium]